MLVPKQQQRDIIKYGTGLRHGQALYLSRKRAPEGEGIFDVIGGIVSKVVSNADTIKTIGSTVGSVANAAGSVAGNIINTVKRARELNQKKQQGISDEALEKVLNAKKEDPAPKTGSGFLYID